MPVKVNIYPSCSSFAVLCVPSGNHSLKSLHEFQNFQANPTRLSSPYSSSSILLPSEHCVSSLGLLSLKSGKHIPENENKRETGVLSLKQRQKVGSLQFCFCEVHSPLLSSDLENRPEPQTTPSLCSYHLESQGTLRDTGGGVGPGES